MKSLFLSFLILFLSSCWTTVQLTSNIKSNQIDSLLFLKPVSQISLISKVNKTAQYDSIQSIISEKNIQNGVNEILPGEIKIIPLISDSMVQRHINKEIRSIISSVKKKQSIKDIPFPPVIDSIMVVNNIDYSLCILHSGFTRTGSNYAGQVAKGVATAVLTLGMFYSVPIKATTDLVCVILDRKNKNIAFYRESNRIDAEPIDKKITDKQIRKIFKQYFKEQV